MWRIFPIFIKEETVLAPVLEQMLRSHCNGSYQRSPGNEPQKKLHWIFCLSFMAKEWHLRTTKKCSEEFSPEEFFSFILPWWAAHLCLSEARWKLKTCRTGISALSFPEWNNTLIVLSVWKKKPCPSPISSFWLKWWEKHPRSDISKSSLSYLYLLMKRTADVICRSRIL